ncbi:CCN family member 3-like [Haliotis rufescens]|uniref:CCN family member 3-like n=1 Tax=Haliotis rufescens TaxID=6454 RepID=UPI00201F48B9|nr:CCN family member 3-like [Haliotis rufescens]
MATLWLVLTVTLLYVGRSAAMSVGSSPGPKGHCLYRGEMFRQGETWNIDCDYNCRCVDDYYGHFICSSECQAIELAPPGCRFKKVSGQCCDVIICDVRS